MQHLKQHLSLVSREANFNATHREISQRSRWLVRHIGAHADIPLRDAVVGLFVKTILILHLNATLRCASKRIFIIVNGNAYGIFALYIYQRINGKQSFKCGFIFDNDSSRRRTSRISPSSNKNQASGPFVCARLVPSLRTIAIPRAQCQKSVYIYIYIYMLSQTRIAHTIFLPVMPSLRSLYVKAKATCSSSTCVSVCKFSLGASGR